MKKLRRGATGDAVRSLQHALNARSKARGLPTVEADGVLGNQTLQAIQRIARALGALESTLRKARADKAVSVGLQRMIRYPATRTPAQLARAKYRAHRAFAVPTQIIGRETWNARSPRGPLGGIGRLERRVIHHTAALASMYRSPVLERLHMRTIQSWHFARGFSDIGYHRVTFPSGRTYAGRPLTAIGAGVAGWNTGSVHYCIAGNYEVERPTDAALAGVRSASKRDGTSHLPPVGHRELQSNACPGRNITESIVRSL